MLIYSTANNFYLPFKSNQKGQNSAPQPQNNQALRFGGRIYYLIRDVDNLEEVQNSTLTRVPFLKIVEEVAPKTNNPEVIRYLAKTLKKHFGDIDHPIDEELTTLLQMVVIAGKPQLVKVLLQEGADPTIQNKSRNDAFQSKFRQDVTHANRVEIHKLLLDRLRDMAKSRKEMPPATESANTSSSSWLSWLSFRKSSASPSTSSQHKQSSAASGSGKNKAVTVEQATQTDADAAQDSALTKQLNASKARTAALQKQLKDAQKVVQHLEKQPETARNVNLKLRAQLSQIVQEKNATLNRLEATLERVTKDRDSKQQQVNQLEQQVIALEDAQSKQQKTSSDEIKQLERLKERLANKTKQIATLNDSLESQRQEYEALIQRLNSEHDAERFNLQLQPPPNDVNAAEDMDLSLRRQNQEMRQKIGRLHRQINYLNGRLAQANEQLSQSQEQNQQWIAQLFQLQAYLTQTQRERALILQHGQQAGQQLLTDFQEQEMTLSTLHQTLSQQQEQLEQQAQGLSQHHETINQLHAQKNILTKTIEHLMHLSSVRQGLATRESRVTQTVLNDLQTVFNKAQTDAHQSPDAVQTALAQAVQFRQHKSEKNPLQQKWAKLQAKLASENRPDEAANEFAQQPKTLRKSRSFS